MIYHFIESAARSGLGERCCGNSWNLSCAEKNRYQIHLTTKKKGCRKDRIRDYREGKFRHMFVVLGATAHSMKY